MLTRSTRTTEDYIAQELVVSWMSNRRTRGRADVGALAQRLHIA